MWEFAYHRGAKVHTKGILIKSMLVLRTHQVGMKVMASEWVGNHKKIGKLPNNHRQVVDFSVIDRLLQAVDNHGQNL